MKKFRTILLASLVTALALAIPLTAQAQTAPTSTTLSSAITATQPTIQVASATSIAAGTQLYLDQEAMLVTTVSGTVLRVQRGYAGTTSAAHIASQTVYAGASGTAAGGPYWASNPQLGSCTYAAEQYTIRIVPSTGKIWACSNGQWMNQLDSFMFVSASSCNVSVSGNGTGTNGPTAIGTAPSIPVVNAQTSNSGTNTHYFVCNIPLPSRADVVKAAYVVDAVFFYGVQTTGLGTQVATLASGTMNSQTVFTRITYPTAAASETATGLVEATRADAGTLTITPVVASSNVATTTAGEFYSIKFTPANPIPMGVDSRQLLMTVSFLNTATSATITNSPGFLVHYRTLQVGF